MTGIRYHFGPTIVAPGRVRFRLWAPDADMVAVCVDAAEPLPMTQVADDWFEVEAACGAGARYCFRIRPDLAVPDPASRSQPDGPHQASMVVDPSSYAWRYPEWTGRAWHQAIVYELHVGLLGGFAGVEALLPELAELGVTAIELMPIAQFPGPRNWGYDGALIYAPHADYGSPDELKRLIDTAHGFGLMVLLDVVYNHFGPEGNYLGSYAGAFYRRDGKTPWGDAIDFKQRQVRRFFIENALYWLTEYRFDGLRFDAVHSIADAGFLLEMAHDLRAATQGRHVHLVLENEAQEASLLRSDRDDTGFDAQWTDDWHHCVHVLLTGETEGYYQDYENAPAKLLARCLGQGFGYQGEPSRRRGGTPRGTPSAHLPPICFVNFLQNHDHIGNRAFGERLTALTHPDGMRAATLLLLLAPQIPMLFMGQEWGASAPFLFFSSFTGQLADAVREGRRREFVHFAAFADPARRHLIPDPNDPKSFAVSIPDRSEIDLAEHRAWLDLHRTLLAIRYTRIVPRIPGTLSISSTALGCTGVLARWRLGDGAILTIAANLGAASLPRQTLGGDVLFALRWSATDTEMQARAAVATLAAPL